MSESSPDKLSVIIPCYNHEKYLKECIESVYNNWLTINFEVIVIDDNSTDNTYEVAKQLSKQYKFKLDQTNTNSKPSGVRNLGINISTGNLIVCLDGDDKIPSNYLQENYNNILMYRVDVSYNNSHMFGLLNKVLEWPEFSLDFIRRSPFVHCSSMFKREVWKKVNGFDESMINGWEDYDFWLRIAKEGFKFKKCPSTFLYYRIHGENRDIKAKQKMPIILDYMREKHKGFYLG